MRRIKVNLECSTVKYLIIKVKNIYIKVKYGSFVVKYIIQYNKFGCVKVIYLLSEVAKCCIRVNIGRS